jgi:pimeloyl-ACP methyl ester carboxylesterase
MQPGRVGTEGDELYYEVRGTGQPLLLIPGGGGDAAAYSLIAAILCDEFKVITYDRRANARSTMNEPQNFEISQQSRDAVAVLQAVDETSAFVLGNSSGAVIALDMAKSHPRVLSERLRCEMVTFPGHHGSFVDMPDQWAATLRDVLHRLNSQLAG